jgi:DNA replication protein DnaC
MLEKLDSLLAEANAIQAIPTAKKASCKRVADTGDLNRIWRRACETGTDDRAYGGECGIYDVPAKTLRQTLEKEIELSPFAIDPADLERLFAAADKEQRRRDGQHKQKRLAEFTKAVGPRFGAATLENYQVASPEQRKVVDALQSYRANIRQHTEAGEGIVLFGSAGTGKTHLLSAVGKTAIDAGLSVGWTNAQDLFASFREAIGADRSEDAIVCEMVKPDLLILDDVLPIGGKLTEYQAGNLYRIVDTRYRYCKPVLISMNVVDGTEAEAGMGAQVVDRLRHGALALFCNWPSYRKAKA